MDSLLDSSSTTSAGLVKQTGTATKVGGDGEEEECKHQNANAPTPDPNAADPKAATKKAVAKDKGGNQINVKCYNVIICNNVNRDVILSRDFNC